MVRNAEQYAEADKQRRELVEVINQAEGIVHDTESKIAEYKDQLPADERESLGKQIEELRAKLNNKENETVESIRTATNNLQQASLKLFELAYKKMASDQSSSTKSDQSSEKQQT
ncbi:molecular chaperone DnaK [Paragonimus westermani]|uniref:Molecular chaperone DnaK n=1 Tax=Paragonimus westermani TaxID=34504 RepID=A0A5J4N9M4_9TREM|nr:molecular chaperone DnaK [Paragonimus westermani]